jgi:hypothetical protein
MTFYVLGLANRNIKEFNQILKLYKLQKEAEERESVFVCVWERERERDK